MELIDANLRRGIYSGAFVLVVYFATSALSKFAGTQTLAFTQIGVSFMASMTMSKWAAWSVAGTSTGLWRREVWLKQRAIRNLSPGKKIAEVMKDPGRSSSHLTSRGTTGEGDLK